VVGCLLFSGDYYKFTAISMLNEFWTSACSVFLYVTAMASVCSELQ